jgi:hypothetical protein
VSVRHPLGHNGTQKPPAGYPAYLQIAQYRPRRRASAACRRRVERAADSSKGWLLILANEHDVEVLVCSENRSKNLTDYFRQLLPRTVCAAKAKGESNLVGISNLSQVCPIELAVEDKRHGQTLLQQPLWRTILLPEELDFRYLEFLSHCHCHCRCPATLGPNCQDSKNPDPDRVTPEMYRDIDAPTGIRGPSSIPTIGRRSS